MHWLIGLYPSLYFSAGCDRKCPAWTQDKHRTLTSSKHTEAVWYLRCGNWNGMTSQLR
jgi:hypothetical protein